MATTKDNLMDWLRDAHAMEKQAETMLEMVAKRIEHYPDLKGKLAECAAESRRQADILRSCIERHGGEVSAMKELGAKFAAAGQALSGYVVGDEVVKAVMSTYVFKNMEIASYTVLLEAARVDGDERTADVCKSFLKDEEAAAAWLRSYLPGVTEKYLGRAAMGVEAKH